MITTTLHGLSIDTLRFQWHGRGPTDYDCIGLVALIQRVYGGSIIDLDSIDWIYTKYPTLDDSPRNIVERLARENSTPVEVPGHLDIAIIYNETGRSSLGVLVHGDVVFFHGATVRVVAIDRFLRYHPDTQFARISSGTV